MINRILVLSAVVISGFSTLAAQVIFPRTLHPHFGSSGDVGSAVVAMALAGLALGYLVGGRNAKWPTRRIASFLTIGGIYLIFIGIVWPELTRLAGDGTTIRLLLCAAFLSLVPSFTLGAISPLAIQALTQQHAERPSERPGLVFGVGTLANVLGGLTAGYWLVPFVGLSRSLIGLGALIAFTAAGVAVLGRFQKPARRPQAEPRITPKNIRGSSTLVALAFYSGVASVAIEVSGTRMLASNFGPTTTLWASVLSVSLGGLAVGYLIGGLLTKQRLQQSLWVVVVANSLWLLASAWGISIAAEARATSSLTTLLFAAGLAFLPTFILFGIESQIIVGLIACRSTTEQTARISGHVFAASTIGGLIGALSGVFFLLPLLGISTFVRVAAVGYLTVLAAVHIKQRMSAVAWASAGLALFLPLPNWQWQNQTGRLLTQQEGRHQTIRVYSDEKTFIRFHLGPTYESEVNLETGEPNFGYARTILDQAGDVEGSQVLVLGGAGHAMARSFEAKGATVTEVEVDPLVAEVSDEYFGRIKGEIVVEDGRRYLTEAANESYDTIVIDAFDGPKIVPPHITTAEFYNEVSRTLTPGGVMYINMIGQLSGPKSGSFDVMSSTVASTFEHAGRTGEGGNIILIGSNSELPETIHKINVTTTPNTDDLNPMEIMISRSG